MKKIVLSISVAAMLLAACNKPANSSSDVSIKEVTALENDNQKFSYFMGLDMGSNMKNDTLSKSELNKSIAAIQSFQQMSEKEKKSFQAGISVAGFLENQKLGNSFDINAFAQGLNDGSSDKKDPLINQEDGLAVFQQVLQKQQEENKKAEEAKATTALAKATKFLEDNKTKANIKTTASGLQYEVITEGTGESPKATDVVEVRYVGTLTDGKEFDSSEKNSQNEAKTIEFPLNQVIPGWTEGIQLMKKGSKYKLYIPPALGYGERGAGSSIGPNEALIFDVELVNIKAPEAPAETPPTAEVSVGQ